MKCAVLTAQADNGKWTELCGPDVPVQAQKERLKAMKKLGGVHGKQKFVTAILFTSAGWSKRIKFSKPAGKPVLGVVTDKSAAERSSGLLAKLAEKFQAEKKAIGLSADKRAAANLAKLPGAPDVERPKVSAADRAAANLAKLAEKPKDEPKAKTDK